MPRRGSSSRLEFSALIVKAKTIPAGDSSARRASVTVRRGEEWPTQPVARDDTAASRIARQAEAARLIDPEGRGASILGRHRDPLGVRGFADGGALGERADLVVVDAPAAGEPGEHEEAEPGGDLGAPVAARPEENGHGQADGGELPGCQEG